MAIVLCQVEQAGLCGEDAEVESGLLGWRRMPAECGVVLPGSLIQVPARGYGVYCLGCSKQRHSGHKNGARFRFGLRRIG